MVSGKDVRRAKKAGIKRAVLSIIFFALALQAARLYAADDRSATDSGTDWTAAKDAELDELRGGFVLDNGMVIDFSLATSVFVNGQERFSDRFELANNLTLDQLRGAIVNNGPSNFAMTDAAMNNIAVIGNTLDNQAISLLRSVDITLSNIKNMSGFGQSGHGFAP